MFEAVVVISKQKLHVALPGDGLLEFRILTIQVATVNLSWIPFECQEYHAGMMRAGLSHIKVQFAI